MQKTRSVLLSLLLLLSGGMARSAQEPWVCGGADLSQRSAQRHVSTRGSDGDGCGETPEKACGTIAQAMRSCPQQPGGCAVLVEYGAYQLAEPLRLRAGVDLYGGCTVRSRAGPGLQSLLQGPPGRPAMESDAGEPQGWKTVQGFRIVGGDAQGDTGEAAIALRVVDPLVLLDSHVVAGRGAAGRAGSAPASGVAGGDAIGTAGGTNPSCPSAQGGRGGSGIGVSVHVGFWSFQCNASCSPLGCYGTAGGYGNAGGGGGAAPGSSNCAECPVSNAGAGNAGHSGTAASCAGGGVASASLTGALQDRSWVAAVGSPGDTGLVGGGGGGGGGGGFFGGACFWVSTERRGGDGGGGGAGGCGGPGGAGGQQGGASIAVQVTGGPLRIEGSRIVAGAGGAGGAGGTGAPGGAPGKAAGGAAGGGSGAGSGGPGGRGGAGGAGGGGAGGNGGPSIGIAVARGSRIDDKDLVSYHGTPGTPGAAGVGGGAVEPGVCQGGAGEPGRAGIAEDRLVF